MDKTLSELDILSTEYIRLLNEKQVLIDWGKPQLESLYLLHLGQLQIKKLNAQLQVMALKRKLELIRAAVNTGQQPDLIQIEVQVAVMLAEAEKKIAEASKDYEKAVIYIEHLHTSERTSELRDVFRRLAKKLHPDVNPGLTELQAELWLKVKEAYEQGDLEQLVTLEIVYREELNIQQVLDEKCIEEQSEKLREGIKRLQTEISMIRNQFPFTHEQLLYCEEWVASQQNMLQNEIEALEAYEQLLRSELETLLND